MNKVLIDLTLSNRDEFLEKYLSFEFSNNIPGFNEIICLKGKGINSSVLFSYFFNDNLVYIELENVTSDHLTHAIESVENFKNDYRFFCKCTFNSNHVFEFLLKQLYYKTCFHFKRIDAELWQNFFIGNGFSISSLIINYCKNVENTLKVICNVDFFDYFNGIEVYEREDFIKRLPTLISNSCVDF